MAVLAASAGCGRADVSEWRASDHAHTGKPAGAQVAAQPGSESNADTLANLAWANQCATCHGLGARGDGPQGRMLRVADLTRPDWQDSASDEDIAQVIRKGRNKMPSFDLPDEVVEALVRKIRSLKR